MVRCVSSRSGDDKYRGGLVIAADDMECLLPMVAFLGFDGPPPPPSLSDTGLLLLLGCSVDSCESECRLPMVAVVVAFLFFFRGDAVIVGKATSPNV